MPASSSTRIEATGEIPLLAAAESDTFKVGSSSISGLGMNRIPQQGKLNVKGCTGADRALHVNFSGVLLDDAVADREAQTGATLVARDVLGGEEGIVDALEVLGRDAGAGIGNHSLHV